MRNYQGLGKRYQPYYLKNQTRRPQNSLYASRRDCVHVLYLPRHDRQFNLHVYDVACLQLHWKNL